MIRLWMARDVPRELLLGYGRRHETRGLLSRGYLIGLRAYRRRRRQRRRVRLEIRHDGRIVVYENVVVPPLSPHVRVQQRTRRQRIDQSIDLRRLEEDGEALLTPLVQTTAVHRLRVLLAGCRGLLLFIVACLRWRQQLVGIFDGFPERGLAIVDADRAEVECGDLRFGVRASARTGVALGPCQATAATMRRRMVLRPRRRRDRTVDPPRPQQSGLGSCIATSV